MNKLIAAVTASLPALGASTACRADEPLDFYLGVASGSADVRISEANINTLLYNGFHQNDVGWKVFTGLRPISLIGAEAEYVDFGNASDRAGNTVHQLAGAVYGMLYAPLPIPLFDVYAKAGLAWLRNTANTQIYSTAPICREIPCGTSPYAFSRNDADAAFGAGVQVKISKLALRVEYERIQSSAATPDLVSLGLTWTF